MNKFRLVTLAMSVICLGVFSNVSANGNAYEVTITNLTKGMTFTPALIASTPRKEKLFAVGSPASTELEILAESGDTVPLEESLDFFDAVTLDFIGPGGSDSGVVEINGQYPKITVASMVIPTNDTFIALNSVLRPSGNKKATYNVVAYDAGTEFNDELCESLPGPGCDGDPGPDSDNGEGFVYVSNGIRGVGDLDADLRDFNNPIARITIRRMR